jgi:hypothetical protein
VERAVRYNIFLRSLKVYILEVDEFLLRTDLLDKGFFRPHISDLDFNDDRMFADDSGWNINAKGLLDKVIEIQENAQYCEDYKRPEAC